LTEEKLVVNEQVHIPLSELSFRFARSSGPGGQHVNRTATRVELLFDVQHSPSLNEQQRELILRRLSGYIDQEGVLHLFSQSTRSQYQNREDVIARFRALMNQGLRVTPKRVPTKPSRAAKEKRLHAKRARSQTKQQRRVTREDWE
jgi:ribosome-associated protein